MVAGPEAIVPVQYMAILGSLVTVQYPKLEQTTYTYHTDPKPGYSMRCMLSIRVQASIYLLPAESKTLKSVCNLFKVHFIPKMGYYQRQDFFSIH